MNTNALDITTEFLAEHRLFTAAALAAFLTAIGLDVIVNDIGGTVGQVIASINGNRLGSAFLPYTV